MLSVAAPRLAPARECTWPPPRPGFERVARYGDPLHASYAAKILPGEYYVTTPSTSGTGWEVADPSQAARCGSFAIELLLDELIERGTSRSRAST